MDTFANTQSASRRALRSKARKLGTPRGSIGAFAVLAIVAAAAASAGAFGTFTNTATVTQSPLTAGTVSIALGATGAQTNRLDIGAGNMAAGDTIERTVDLENTGTLDLSSIDLTTAPSGTPNALTTDTTNGLQMKIEVCDQAWTETGSSAPFTYTCGGATSTVLASTAAAVTNSALSNVNLLANPTNPDHLMVTLTLPSGADEATFGGLSTDLVYTFTATQRTAAAQ
jgi:spore coat-associated protein N